MRKFVAYISMVLLITIILPTVIVKTFNFVPRETNAEGNYMEFNIGEKVKKAKKKDKKEKIKKDKNPPLEIVKSDLAVPKINMYNNTTGEVSELDVEEYVKGVVAAEMPAEFHIEALKAQAVAARTYAISRTIKYKNGHPDHVPAPICNGVHCQAYLSFPQLNEIHGEEWIGKYWPKIVEAVDDTKNLALFYGGQIIEPLYHSTSGGQTEDVMEVFSSVEIPYLKSVSSPYESEAPKYSTTTTMTIDEFIKKIKDKYPEVNINKDNIHEKIKLINRTVTGRVKKIAIDKMILDGKDLRNLFQLNSTNFTIYLDKDLNIIEIKTLGFGHGVGMSQWGANGMAKKGSTFQEILEHYYTGINIVELN